MRGTGHFTVEYCPCAWWQGVSGVILGKSGVQGGVQGGVHGGVRAHPWWCAWWQAVGHPSLGEFQKHVEAMQQPQKTWGDDATLLAASCIFEVDNDVDMYLASLRSDPALSAHVTVLKFV